ncbi:MAG TPA: hypothetical protein VGK30_02180 [Candidatus Binatia bacterium]|jgi:hypothetical protein
MRKIGAVLCLVLLGCVAFQPTSARAAQTPIADQPGATLLLPYFEVALPKGLTGKTKGVDTLFAINNASATAILAHVTIWSDLSVPVLAFNVYLTGYDMQTIDLGQLLTGTLPATASAGQDPGDMISKHGSKSQDINFASCTGQLPFTQMPNDYIAHVQDALTGQPSDFFLGLCAGLDHRDRIARGYVTVDTVNNCTLRFHSDPGYITSDLTFQNVLWGDYFYIDTKGKTGKASSLVSVRADFSDPEVNVPGNYTFYGRYDAFTAIDHRQPLSTNFAARFVAPSKSKTATFPTGSSLIVWRDSKVNQGPFPCALKPPWFPLGQEGATIFDEQEHPEVPMSIPLAPQPPIPAFAPFPAEAQRVVVGSAAFPVPFESGWVYLNLNTTVAPAGPVPPEDPAAAQAWVTATYDAKGRYSIGYRAIQLDSAENALHFGPGF